MAYYHLFWDTKNQQPYIVKSGFSFLAFFFGFFYFLYHRAWISAGAFFAANIMIAALQLVFLTPETVSLIISLGFHVYIGFDAADCLFGEYHKKGYRFLKSDFFASTEHATAAIFRLE